MKGKTVPVPVFSINEELGTRVATARDELPLIGREDELTSLRTALEKALEGEGGVITVTAATGLGKSRLVTEAMRGLDVVISTVRAEPYGMTSPYRMLRDPVREALGVERGDPHDMTEQALAGFERLVPDLLPMAPLLDDLINVPLPMTPEAAAIEPRFRPARVADIVLRIVEASVRGPFVLMVEEGHWSDNASITVLDRIVAGHPGRPWAVLVARRNDGGGFEPAEGTRIELGPLPAAARCAGSCMPLPRRRRCVLTRWRRSSVGLVATRSTSRSSRVVSGRSARWRRCPTVSVALDAQIDALDPSSRRVLRYASVLGRSFRTEVLAETLRGESLQADDATLAKLSSYLESDGRTRLRFRTGMIRDAAYEGLAYRLRAKLHASAGFAVEKLSTDLDADSDTLSLHFGAAGIPRRRGPTREWRVTARRAPTPTLTPPCSTRRHRCLAGARRHLRPGAPRPVAAHRRGPRARRHVRGRDRSLPSQLEAGRGRPRHDREPPAAAGRTRQRFEAYTTALSELTRAERLLAGDDSLAARQARVRVGSLRAGIRNEQERLVEARAEARAVVDAARDSGEIEALEQALILMDTAAFQLGDTGVGDATREALRICLEHGHLQRASIAQVCLGGFAFYTGRWGEAVESFDGARQNALAVGDVVGAAMTALSLGEVYLDRGALDEATEVLTDAVRVLRVAGAHSFAAYGQVHLARILLARGELLEAEKLAEETELELTVLGQKVSALEATLVRAEAVSRQGRHADALELVEVSAESAKGEGVALLPRVHLERTRALLGLGRVADAAIEAEAGLSVARLYRLPYEEAGLLVLQAELLAVLDDPERSAEARTRADEILERLLGS